MHSDLFSKIPDEKGCIHGSQKSREGPHSKQDTEKDAGNLPDKKAGNRELFDHPGGKELGRECRLCADEGGIRNIFDAVKNWKGILQLGAVSLIRFYQKCISPALPPMCRFYPSCSEYALLAIKQYGFLKGGVKSMIRILKCHPFHPGGYDPLT